MSVHRGTRFCVLFSVCVIFFGLPPDFHAQNRLLARVEPNANKINSTAETYDPAGGTFSLAAGTMSVSREDHAETRLLNGKVLITGGVNDVDYLNTAEIYDPINGTFAATTGRITAAREGFTQTLLVDGTVLIAGGSSGSQLATAEVYDPPSRIFTHSKSSCRRGGFL
jgi:hypothetical protein